MNPAARLVALLDAQAAAWDARAAGRAGAGRRHHGRHSGGGAIAAGGRPSAERRGGAAGPRHRHVRARLERAGRCASAGRPAPGCCTGWVPRAAMSARGRRRRPMRPSRRAARRCRRRCCRRTPWRNGGHADRGGDRRSDAAVARRSAGGSRRHRHGAARGARNPGRHRRTGDAGPRSGGAGGDRTAALWRGGRRQRRRGLGRIAAGRVPPPAGPCRGGGTGAGRAARAAEASAGGGRPVARRLPRGRACAGTGLSARPATDATV